MSDTNNNNNNNTNAQGTVFANESAMMQQLQAMGMPKTMLANLTPQQRAAMLAMTASPEIQARAAERVAHEEDWKQAKAQATQRGTKASKARATKWRAFKRR